MKNNLTLLMAAALFFVPPYTISNFVVSTMILAITVTFTFTVWRYRGNN